MTRGASAAHLRGAVAGEACAAWLERIDRRYAAIAAAAGADPDYSVHASSLRLHAAGIGWRDVWRAGAPALHDALAASLDGDVACAADECWVRRQYAPRHAPPRHAPHAWHQDGALGFDFVANADASVPAGALAAMLTCWIALVPCGVDAPGLEIAATGFDRLLSLRELEAAAGSGRAAGSRPALDAGDALLFDGGVLHRTHVTPAMANDRTSVELRFFDLRRLPARLRALRLERF